MLRTRFYKIILFILITSGLQACGQNKPTETMIKELLGVKRYEQHPEYRLEISGMNCNWEIEVNDMPFDNYLGSQGGTSGDIPLNTRILSSGVQKIKLKVFPLEGEKLMSIYSTLRLVLSYYGDNKNYKGTMKELNNYSLPAALIKNLPYFEYEFSFDAKVPYTQVGWINSKDLSKVPDIKERVISKLNELTKIIQDRDNRTMFGLDLEKRKDRYESFYASDSSIIEDIEEGDFNNDFSDLHDCHYVSSEFGELVYYANNRIVSIRHRGKTSYNYGIQINGLDDLNKVSRLSYQFLFHIPNGTDELKIVR